MGDTREGKDRSSRADLAPVKSVDEFMDELETIGTETATAKMPSIVVTRPSARSTGLSKAVPTLALPAAKVNMTTAVVAVHAIPRGLWCGW